jgi:hypothetical protein
MGALARQAVCDRRAHLGVPPQRRMGLQKGRMMPIVRKPLSKLTVIWGMSGDVVPFACACRYGCTLSVSDNRSSRALASRATARRSQTAPALGRPS